MSTSKAHLSAPAKVLPCTCRHDAYTIDPFGNYPGTQGQDEIHGPGMRVHNPGAKGYTCSVCGNTKVHNWK